MVNVEMKEKFDPELLSRELLSKLKKDREREVLIKRFSLDGMPKRTLEEIGQPYKITRERVRQIEKSAIAKLRKAIKNLDSFEVMVVEALKKEGGVASSERLIEKLLGKDSQNEAKRNALLFLLHIDPEFSFIDEDKVFQSSWTLSALQEIPLRKLLDLASRALGNNGKTLTLTELSAKIRELSEFKDISSSYSDQLLSAVLAASKTVMTAEGGKYGLVSWRDINPRSIKDKTYFVLKKSGRPMHFGEISKAISGLRFDSRSVTKQAVHNELIRDGRFVLIGRGIYALSEWGYHPGTVSDVIVEILRNNGKPMHKNEIVKEVLKKRHVKETTIVLNLQNKKLFRRVAKATYALV